MPFRFVKGGLPTVKNESGKQIDKGQREHLAKVMELYINLALRWIHILSAITLVGGVLYTRFAVLPLLESLDEQQRETIGAAMRKNWAKFLMISVLLLLVTGIANMILVPMYNVVPKPTYGMLAGIKFMLALPVFFIVSVLNGRSSMAEKVRANHRLSLNIAVALCVVVVLLAGYLRFLPRTPKSNDSSEPAAANFHSPAQASWHGHFSAVSFQQKA